jgi:HEAT repeat protein
MAEPRNPAVATQQARVQASAALAHRLAHLPDEMGVSAVGELRATLSHPEPWVRLHAVEGLARIDADDARMGLVTALHDESFGVHWEAARALASAGRAGVVTVLRALLRDTPSTGFLHGATLVLRHARLTPDEQAAVAPVREALQRPAADLEAPVVAFDALQCIVPETVAVAERPLPWYDALSHRARPAGATPRTAESVP